MIMTSSTIFHCKICNATVTFNINDERTFLSKQQHKSFFGMELSTYRVQHVVNNEVHVNAIIVDHKGLFRGYLDAYTEKKSSTMESTQLSFQELTTLSCDLFSIFYYIELQKMEAIELVVHSSINRVNLIKTILTKTTEALQIYNDKNIFTFSVADLEITVIHHKGVLLVYELVNNNYHTIIAELLEDYLHLINLQQDSVIISLQLLLYVLSHISPPFQKEYIINLLTNPFIFSSIEIKYTDKIARIVNRLQKEFTFSEELLTQLLSGELTINQLLLTDPASYIELEKLVEFINRRKILG